MITSRYWLAFALMFALLMVLLTAGFVVWCIVEAIRGWRRRPTRVRYRDLDPAHRTGQFTAMRDYKDRS